MSSLIRKMQLGIKHGKFAGLLSSPTDIRGSKVGVHNDQAKDLLARLGREARRRQRAADVLKAIFGERWAGDRL